MLSWANLIGSDRGGPFVSADADEVGDSFLQRCVSTDEAITLVTFVANSHPLKTDGAALHPLRFGACGVC